MTIKQMLDCDQVFDRLTRSPFPSGERDELAVDRHLTQCDSCREIALAMRPAIGLMHEAMDDFESLPSYRGRLIFSTDESSKTGGLDEFHSYQQVAGSGQRNVRAVLYGLLASAMALSFFFMFGLLPLLDIESSDSRLAQWKKDQLNRSMDQDSVSDVTLALQHKPAHLKLFGLLSANSDSACKALREFVVAMEADLRNGERLVQTERDCCTQCHSVNKPRANHSDQAKSRDIALIVNACTVCHVH
jgi:hypothetical protein